MILCEDNQETLRKRIKEIQEEFADWLEAEIIDTAKEPDLKEEKK